MRQIIRKCKWIILGIFVMFLAVCTMRKLYEDTPVEYCKNIISCKNGYAAVFEDDWAISVVTFNDNGVIEQKAVKLHNNPFLVKEHNYRTVFEENGDIYIMGCVYSSDSKNVQWRVEKCDFTTGTFTTEWVLAQREGYSFVSGNIPRVIDGNLYVIYQEESTKDAVTFKVTPDDKYEIVSRTSIPDGAMLEKTVYTSDGTFAITTSYGMFLGDERIYPKKKNDKCMLSGIGYTDDTVSVIDINTSEMVVYSAKDKKINKTAFIMGEYSKYQSVRINSDKSITCSYEDGENLY